MVETIKKEYVRFIRISLGSLREVDTQLFIAKEVGLASTELFVPVMKEVDELQRILVSTLQKIES